MSILELLVCRCCVDCINVFDCFWCVIEKDRSMYFKHGPIFFEFVCIGGVYSSVVGMMSRYPLPCTLFISISGSSLRCLRNFVI